METRTLFDYPSDVLAGSITEDEVARVVQNALTHNRFSVELFCNTVIRAGEIMEGEEGHKVAYKPQSMIDALRSIITNSYAEQIDSLEEYYPRYGGIWYWAWAFVRAYSDQFIRKVPGSPVLDLVIVDPVTMKRQDLAMEHVVLKSSRLRTGVGSSASQTTLDDGEYHYGSYIALPHVCVPEGKCPFCSFLEQGA